MTKSNNDTGWRELAEWVELNIFGYESNQKLQKQSCLVLQGLKHGQNVANNKCAKYGDYSYEVILMTFKIYKNQILNSILGKNFESERNKMSYVCAIIRDKINDVQMRKNQADKSAEKIERINPPISNKELEFTNKTKESKSSKFDDLW